MKYFRPEPRKNAHRINEEITAREVLVIGSNGDKLGTKFTRDAIVLARQEGLDLIEVAGSANPTVCRIGDYGKMKYDDKKRKRQTRRKVHSGEIKEIRLRPRTDKHDMDFKLAHGRQFLAEGHKLQITISFRGRENARKDLGTDLMNQIIESLDDVAKLDRSPLTEGRRLSAVFSPKGKGDAKAKNKQVGGQAVQAQPQGQAAIPPAGQAAPGVGEVPGPASQVS